MEVKLMSKMSHWPKILQRYGDYDILPLSMLANFEKSEIFGLNVADKDALAVTKDWVFLSRVLCTIFLSWICLLLPIWVTFKEFMRQKPKLFKILECFCNNSAAVYSKWEVDEMPPGWNFLSGVDGIGILQEYQSKFLSEKQPDLPITYLLSY